MSDKTILKVLRAEYGIKGVLSDLSTFGFLAFCIYISQGSTWWTFLTGCMFLFFLFAKTAHFFKTQPNVFYSYDEVIKWAESEKVKVQK